MSKFSVCLSVDLTNRVDDYVQTLKKERPGLSVTRTDAINVLLEAGFRAEAQPRTGDIVVSRTGDPNRYAVVRVGGGAGRVVGAEEVADEVERLLRPHDVGGHGVDPTRPAG